MGFYKCIFKRYDNGPSESFFIKVAYNYSSHSQSGTEQGTPEGEMPEIVFDDIIVPQLSSSTAGLIME